MDEQSSESQKEMNKKQTKVTSPLPQATVQNKAKSVTKSATSHTMLGNEKGSSKEAKSGHLSKMKTPSTSYAAKVQGKDVHPTPEKGSVKGRKIKFSSYHVNVKSVQEDAQHPKANSTKEATGIVRRAWLSNVVDFWALESSRKEYNQSSYG
ncbi:unnamed protein product [Linum trigynum]|uniref:Uncharacterized protein n=1 Tax=Linum trigynum TaxID=586398 RepID=A0AAV2E3R8_9ROSI